MINCRWENLSELAWKLYDILPPTASSNSNFYTKKKSKFDAKSKILLYKNLWWNRPQPYVVLKKKDSKLDAKSKILLHKNFWCNRPQPYVVLKKDSKLDAKSKILLYKNFWWNRPQPYVVLKKKILNWTQNQKFFYIKMSDEIGPNHMWF